MPISMAMGMVADTVKVPHGLSGNALTTMRASTARRMTEERDEARYRAHLGFNHVAKRTPSRRVHTNSMMKSCTAPANTTPARIHSVPGK
jgi:hypothetical protein